MSETETSENQNVDDNDNDSENVNDNDNDSDSDSDSASDNDSEMAGDDDNDNELTETERSQLREDPPPTWISWGARLVSVAVIACLLGYLVVNGLGDQRPAEVVVRGDTSAIEARAGAWTVPAVVENRGDVSVEQVVASAELVDATGAVIASTDLSVPLLGAGDRIEVLFWFPQDPATGTLDFSVGGFVVP